MPKHIFIMFFTDRKITDFIKKTTTKTTCKGVKAENKMLARPFSS